MLLGKLWNALLTAVVLTLVAGLFVAAMPPVFKATATVQGANSDQLLLQSADFLAEVARTTSVDMTNLRGWQEELLEGGAALDKITILQQKLSVTDGAQSGWIDISIEAADPKTAAMLADELAKAFAEQKRVRQISSSERESLIERAQAVESDIQQQLAADSRLLDFSSAKRGYEISVTQLSQKIAAGQAEESRLREQAIALQRRDTSVLTEPGVIRAAERLANKELEQTALAQRYGPSHQRSLAMQAALKEASAMLEQEFERYDAALAARIADKGKAIAAFEAQRREATVSIQQLEAAIVAYEGLRLRHNTLLAALQGLDDGSAVLSFAKAVPPRNSFGRGQLVMLAGVFTGTFLLGFIILLVAPAVSRNT